MIFQPADLNRPEWKAHKAAADHKRDLQHIGAPDIHEWMDACIAVVSTLEAFKRAVHLDQFYDPANELSPGERADYGRYVQAVGTDNRGELDALTDPLYAGIDDRPVTLLPSDVGGGRDFHGRAEYLIYEHECAHLDMVDALYFRGQATADDVNAQVRRVAAAFRVYAGELKSETAPRKKARKDIRLSGSAAR